jgi:Na+-driven multidrug efflux pump
MFVAPGNGAGATHIEHCLKGNEIARMRRDHLNREILRLAGPNILSNLTVPLIGSVDVVLMGGLSAAHIGALGVGTMIFNVLYWNFGFLRMGTTGITAQTVGRQDDEAAGLTLVRALITATVISLLIFAAPGTHWAGPPYI